MKSKNPKMRISITIMPSLNLWLEDISKKEKISKSCLIEMAIKLHLEDKLARDAKKLANIKFDADEWLKIQENV